jgi:hypothetical protein
MTDRREYNRNYMRKWSKNNPDKIKESQKKCITKLREEIIQLLGGKCSNPDCPIPPEKMDKRALQIDHINGGGTQEVKKYRGNYLYHKHILSQLKAGSKDYQLLCANCNWIKRYENNELNQYNEEKRGW